METKEKYNGFKVGDKVMCNGYEGRVTELCGWSDSLIEVRLDAGGVCVDSKDSKTVTKLNN